MKFKRYIACKGVKINDKHIEVIVNQMMLKVSVKDPGDTWFLEEDKVSKESFLLKIRESLAKLWLTILEIQI